MLKGPLRGRSGNQTPVCQLPKCKPPDILSAYFVNKTEEGSVMKSIKFPVISSAVISHSYQKKCAQKARQDVDTLSANSRWVGKSGHTLTPVALIFFYFPVRLLVPPKVNLCCLQKQIKWKRQKCSGLCEGEPCFPSLAIESHT